MKITKLSTFKVPPRWLFLKIDTDEGISGWGEPILEGHADTLAVKVKELDDFLIGIDPLNIEDTWQKLYRNGCYRGGPVLMSAMSGVDMALWDIKGKAYGQPINALLGGPVRSKVRSYCWIGGDRSENLVEEAKKSRSFGYEVVKFNVCSELQILESYKKIDQIVKDLSELRDNIGNTLDLIFDFHGRVHAPMSKILLKELEFLRPLFIEDPVLSAQIDTMKDLAQSTSIPLCIGERMHSRYEFKSIFEKRVASVINPDPCHVGGISETIRVGNMAEAYDIALAPHCPLGPIALAACLQVDAVCYNAVIQEHSLGIHYNQKNELNDYLQPESKFQIKNGYITIPTKPGLGIEVNEEAVNEGVKQKHNWRAPVWRHIDGSISEW